MHKGSLTLLQGRDSEHFLLDLFHCGHRERFLEQADLGYNPAFFMNTGQGNFNKRSTADPFFILKAGNILPTSQSSDENQIRESRWKSSGYIVGAQLMPVSFHPFSRHEWRGGVVWRFRSHTWRASLKFSDKQQSPGRRSFNLSEPEFSKPRKKVFLARLPWGLEITYLEACAQQKVALTGFHGFPPCHHVDFNGKAPHPMWGQIQDGTGRVKDEHAMCHPFSKGWYCP